MSAFREEISPRPSSARIESKVETIFGDSVENIDQTEKGVHVTFERGGARNFDLVVGADGLHSRIRELVFGRGKPI